MRKAFQLRRAGLDGQQELPLRPATASPGSGAAQAVPDEFRGDDSCPTPPPIKDRRFAAPPSPRDFDRDAPSPAAKRASTSLFSRVKPSKKPQIPYIDPASAAAASLYFDSASVKGDRSPSRAAESIASPLSSPTSPSVVVSPAKPGKSRPRTPDFPTTRPGSGASVESGASNPLYQHVDSKQILSWMESSRGRMRGDIFFRTKVDPTALSEWRSAYCYIKADDGSLRYEQPPSSPFANGEAPAFHTLADHLHGCQVYVASSTDGWPAIHVRLRQQSAVPASAASAVSPRRVSLREQNARLREAGAFKGPLLDVHNHIRHDLEIRPADDAHITAWLAALLCWKPVRPGRSTLDVTEITAFQTYLARPAFDGPSDEEHVVVKSGEARLYDTATLSSLATPTSSAPDVPSVACLLRANGEFSFRKLDGPVSTLVQVQLLPRSAIRLMDLKLTGSNNALIIFPSHSASREASSRLRPFALSFPTRTLLESWFLLLKTFATPEILRPDFSQAEDDFALSEDFGTLEPGVHDYQLQQSIELQVTDLSFSDDATTSGSLTPTNSRPGDLPHQRRSAEFDICLLADGHPMARTVGKASLDTGVVSRHDRLAISDLPQNVLRFSLRVARREGAQEESDERRPDTATTNFSSDEPDTADAFICYNAVPAMSEEVETRQLLNKAGMHVGQITFRYSYRQDPLLAEAQYEPVMTLLRSLKNGLTLKLYASFPASSAAHSSGLLLSVFQSAAAVTTWLQDLITKEILQSSDPKKVVPERGKAPQSAPASSSNNTLFRDNTLLTRAFDEYMKRVGRQYLEDTLGQRLRAVKADDFHCEVDPSLVPAERAAQNWEYLVFTVRSLWKAISGSAQRCPQELRDLFRHARDTAFQAFGPNSPQVYSSVTAFLFLRFFVPAIMAPHLWDLLPEQPNDRVTTTFKHLSRTINTLANLTEFGVKQPWMLPMNEFILPHRQSMIDFINEPASRPGQPDPRAKQPPPPAPAKDPTTRLKERLPAPLREGLPILPGLVTAGSAVRELSDWWIDHIEHSPGLANGALDISSDAFDPALSRFTRACRELRATARDVVRLTQRVRRDDSVWASEWLAIAEAVEERPDSVWRAAPPRTPTARGFAATPKARRGSTRASVVSGASSTSSDRNRASRMHSRDSRPADDRDRLKSRDAKAKTPRRTKSPPRVDPYENMKRKMGWDM